MRPRQAGAVKRYHSCLSARAEVPDPGSGVENVPAVGQGRSLVQAQASGLPEVLTAVSDLHVRQAIGAICVLERACSPFVDQAFDGERAVQVYHRPSMPPVLEFVVSVSSAPGNRRPC